LIGEAEMLGEALIFHLRVRKHNPETRASVAL